jgi:hypothetical protein
MLHHQVGFLLDEGGAFRRRLVVEPRSLISRLVAYESSVQRGGQGHALRRCETIQDLRQRLRETADELAWLQA